MAFGVAAFFFMAIFIPGTGATTFMAWVQWNLKVNDGLNHQDVHTTHQGTVQIFLKLCLSKGLSECFEMCGIFQIRIDFVQHLYGNTDDLCTLRCITIVGSSGQKWCEIIYVFIWNFVIPCKRVEDTVFVRKKPKTLFQCCNCLVMAAMFILKS